MTTAGPVPRQPGVVRPLKYVRSWWPPESVSPVPMVIEGDFVGMELVFKCTWRETPSTTKLLRHLLTTMTSGVI